MPWFTRKKAYTQKSNSLNINDRFDFFDRYCLPPLLKRRLNHYRKLSFKNIRHNNCLMEYLCQNRSIFREDLSHLHIFIGSIGLTDIRNLLQFFAGRNELEYKSILLTAVLKLLLHSVIEGLLNFSRRFYAFLGGCGGRLDFSPHFWLFRRLLDGFRLFLEFVLNFCRFFNLFTFCTVGLRNSRGRFS